MVDLNDEVELTKNRIGIVRYKGALYGKNGIYYGIELTQGIGKHGGLFRGKRYFSCHRTKGIFVDKKQILFKFTNDPIHKNPKIKCKKSKNKTYVLSRTTSADLGKGRFKIPRKTGPSHAQKSSHKSDWKPPSFMQDVLDDIEYDYEFLGERLSHRGKFQPHTKYDKAGYLPHAKWKKPIWKADDWNQFLAGINDETLRIEMEKQMIEWKEELNETQNYLSDSEVEDITNKRILLEEEIKEMQCEKDKLQAEYDKKQQQQRMRELSEELLEQKLEEERLFVKKEKELTRKQIEQKELHFEMESEQLKLTKLEEKRVELENIRCELEQKEERLKIEKENSNKKLEFEKEKLKKEREKMKNELDKQRIEIEKLAKEKEFQNEQKIKILNNERKKLENTHRLLEEQRKQQLENEQELERKEWEERRIKIEQMKIEEKKDRQRRMNEINNSDSDDRKREESPKGGYSSSDCSSKTSNKSKSKKKRKKKRRRKKRKRKEPKTPKKDYKIYFSVNIETNENCEDLISNTEPLKYLLSDLFETKSEKEVFDIKTREKANGFKIDFGIIIATSMHPADYIDTFDDLTMDGSFQEIIKEGFDLNNNPSVHIWEARYEKVDPKKQRKRKNYY